VPRDYKHNCPCTGHPFECFGHPDKCPCAKDDLSENRVTILQQKRAAELALKLDEGLGLVVASPEGADIYLGDLIIMGVEISDLLREVGGLPPLARS
jgi:hypothetical protein